MANAMKKIIITLLFCAGTANAEIYNCDGKWTNKPCKGEATQVLKESISTGSVSQKSELDQKIEELAKFKRFNKEGEEKYGIFVDFPPIEKFCLDKEITIDDCRNKLSRAKIALEGKIREKKNVEASKR